MRVLTRAAAACLFLSTYGCGNSTPMVAPPSTLQTVLVSAFGNLQGPTVQLAATARFSDTGRDVTRVAAWQSSNPGVATVSAIGVLTIVTPGMTTITATYEGKSGSLTLTLPFTDF